VTRPFFGPSPLFFARIIVRILTVKDECDINYHCLQLLIHPCGNGRFQSTCKPVFGWSSVSILTKRVDGKVGIFELIITSTYTKSYLQCGLTSIFTPKFIPERKINLSFLIILSGNVHVNPGPNTKKMLIGTYNVRGASDKNKTKRLLNYIASKHQYDRMIYSFQETHITEKRRSELHFSWRGDFVLSPGNSNSRGVLTCFTHKSFDSILYKFGDPNGRSTWIVGEYDKKTELFVSVYAPNNGRNKEYYVGLMKEVEKSLNSIMCLTYSFQATSTST
jgi:hypothetical protein